MSKKKLTLKYDWAKYKVQRARAHANIEFLVRTTGVEVSPRDPMFNLTNPETGLVDPEQYGEFWEAETFLEGTKQYGRYQKDTDPIEVKIVKPTNLVRKVYFVYLNREDAGGGAIPKKSLMKVLSLIFVEAGAEFEEDWEELLRAQKRGKGSQTGEVMDITYITANPKVKIIIASDGPLDGAARNYITSANPLLQGAIRHFTLDELQYNPLKHKFQPKLTLAPPETVKRFVKSQRGLKLTNGYLAAQQEKDLAEAEPGSQAAVIAWEALREEILSKIPTVSYDSAPIKWANFRPGDIIIVHWLDRPPSLERVIVITQTKTASKKS